MALIDIEWWQILLIMVVIVVLVLIPVVTWYLRKKALDRKKKARVPPLMYITTVEGRRTDVDIPVIPSPSDASYLPPSYEEICNGAADNHAYLSSSTSLNNDSENLPDYASVASQRSSMVLSTFYTDETKSISQSVDNEIISVPSYVSSDDEHESENMPNVANPPLANRRATSVEELSRDELGVYVA